MQPDPADYSFDLDRALATVVGVRSTIPADAFSAETLGTERAGSGVLIRADGLVLTIGYLVTEAETVWISLNDGRAFPGHVLGQDHETGFGLVQILARADFPALPLGHSSKAQVGERVLVGGAGGRQRSIASRIVAKHEFAGYWEYFLDEAIFTAPAHPVWGGTALIGSGGDLLGIGSLQLEHQTESGAAIDLNMMVPIDLLKPILEDLATLGRRKDPARPWLGIYATNLEGHVIVTELARRGPARSAGVRPGDIIVGVAGADVSDLAAFYRRIWALGEAGVEVPLKIVRDGRPLEKRVRSADRRRVLNKPRLH
jgi:S1-C subfamily serine protease